MHFGEKWLKLNFKWGPGGLVILTFWRSNPPLKGKNYTQRFPKCSNWFNLTLKVQKLHENAPKNHKTSQKIDESEGRVENWRAFRHVFQDLSSSTLQAEYEIMLENSRAFRHVFQEFSNYTLQAEYEIMPENSRAFRHVFQEFSKYTLQAEYEIMSENSRAFRHAFQRLAK